MTKALRTAAGWLLLVAVVVASAPAPVARQGDPLTAAQRGWLDEHGPIRVGWIADLPPVAIVDEGEYVGGWGYEVLELAALKVAADLEPVTLPDLPSAVAALAAGEVDALGIAGPRPDLLAIAEPTEPFGWPPIVLVAGAGRPDAVAYEDLAGGTVTTIVGSPMEAQLAEAYPDLEYVETPTVAAGVAAVAAGEIDAYFGPLAVIGYVLQQQGGRDLRPIGEAASIVPTSAWALPENPALDILRTARSLLTEDEMRLIHVRWTGFDLTDPTSDPLPRWLLPGLAVAVGLILALAAFAFLLRRRVQAATAELLTYQEDLEQLVEARTAQLAEANAKLGDSNDALLSFAGSVAHDLRGPLAATAGLAEALRTGMMDDHDQSEILTRIEVAARRAAELVADMLRAASEGPQSGRRVDAVQLERWLGELLSPELEANRSELSFTASAEVIDLPSQPVRQLLANLVGNAIKYAGRGAHIHADVSRVGASWAITVDDDGPGVPEGDRERIFDAGVQLDGGSSGEGRGLAACRELVSELGGELACRESPSGGARFVATLPDLQRAAATV